MRRPSSMTTLLAATMPAGGLDAASAAELAVGFSQIGSISMPSRRS